MDRQYTFKVHPITAGERLWLAAAAQPGFSVGAAKVDLHQALGRDFYPEQFDPRLFVIDRITPVGLWHADPQHPLLLAMDHTIRYIRTRILAKLDVSVVTAAEVANASGLSEEIVRRSMFALGELGRRFFDLAQCLPANAHPRQYTQIELRDHGSFDEYLRYEGLDRVLEEFYTLRGKALWAGAEKKSPAAISLFRKIGTFLTAGFTVATLIALGAFLAPLYFYTRTQTDRQLELQSKRAVLEYDRPEIHVARLDVMEPADILLPDGTSISAFAQSQQIRIRIAFDVTNGGATYAQDAMAGVKLTIPDGWSPVTTQTELPPVDGFYKKTLGRIVASARKSVEFEFFSVLDGHALELLEFTREHGTLMQLHSARVMADLLEAGFLPSNTLKVDMYIAYDDAFGNHRRDDYCWFETGTAKKPYEKCTADVLTSPIPVDSVAVNEKQSRSSPVKK